MARRIMTIFVTAIVGVSLLNSVTMADEMILDHSDKVEEGVDAEDFKENDMTSDVSRTKRDELEQEQLISYDPDRQMELSGIVTDLDGEDEAISAMGREVLKFLANAESYNALNIVLGDEWIPTMLTQNLVIGQRNYHLDIDGLSGDIMVVSDELGNQYTAIRSYSQTYGLSYLEVSPETIRFMVLNGPTARQYFVVQTLNTSDGTFLANEGFMTESGVMTDKLTVYMSDMMMETEAADGQEGNQGFSLIEAWAKRYNTGLTYEGSFDESGRTTIETPDDLAAQGQLCYALQAQTGETLYLYIEDTPEHVFTGEEFGVFTVWDE